MTLRNLFMVGVILTGFAAHGADFEDDQTAFIRLAIGKLYSPSEAVQAALQMDDALQFRCATAALNDWPIKVVIEPCRQIKTPIQLNVMLVVLAQGGRPSRLVKSVIQLETSAQANCVLESLKQVDLEAATEACRLLKRTTDRNGSQ